VAAAWLPGWKLPARLMMYEPVRHLVRLSGGDGAERRLAVALISGPVHLVRIMPGPAGT
jgi:hypothetical protein